MPDLPPPSKRRKTMSPLRHSNDTDDDFGAIDADIDASVAGASSSVVASTNMVCAKHPMHLFNDKDESVECFLTEQLLGIRRQLESKFSGCDVYQPRKPKGNY